MGLKNHRAFMRCEYFDSQPNMDVQEVCLEPRSLDHEKS